MYYCGVVQLLKVSKAVLQGVDNVTKPRQYFITSALDKALVINVVTADNGTVDEDSILQASDGVCPVTHATATATRRATAKYFILIMTWDFAAGLLVSKD